MTDRLTVQIVVVALAALAILTASGIIGLAWQEKPIPDALIGISSGSIAGLVGLLVSTRSAPEPPKESK